MKQVDVLLEDGDLHLKVLKNVRLVAGYSHGKEDMNMGVLIVLFCFIFMMACLTASTIHFSMLMFVIATMLLGYIMLSLISKIL